MAKVKTIPATISQFTAAPINSTKNAVLPDMPVFQPTMKTRQQATKRRSIITPATSKAEMIGSSSPSTRMKASQQRTQKSERASKR